MKRCGFDCGDAGRCVRRVGHPGLHVPRLPDAAKSGNVLDVEGYLYAIRVHNGKARDDRRPDKDPGPRSA